MGEGNELRSSGQSLPHRLALEERNRLTAGGIQEVLRFDDRTVVLRTRKDVLIVRGEGLRLKQLAPEGGQVTVTGSVCAVSYETAVNRQGRLRRLFG